MEESNHREVVYPSEEEVKSFFPDDIWTSMAEYERHSYRNILHNYYVMKSLDMKPKKPLFMTLHQQKATKRKAKGNICPVPTKIQQPTIEKTLNRVRPMKVQGTTEKEKKEKLKAKEQKTKEESVHLQKKAAVLFDDIQKWRSIRAELMFSAVFKVYKRYRGIIKGQFLSKRRTIKVSKKYTSEAKRVDEETDCLNEIDKNVNKGEINTVEKKVDEKKVSLDRIRGFEQVRKEQALKPAQVDKVMDNCVGRKEVVSAGEDKAKVAIENSQTSKDTKQEDVKQINRVTIRKTKPVCRSVQTMTVAEGCSPSNSALVFVNAASSRKLTVALPDPAPLTAEQKKLMKKIDKQKMKNCRSVQTQTVAENSSLEEAELVFFPKPKPRKRIPKPTTQSDPNTKVSLSIDKQVGVSSTNPHIIKTVDQNPLTASDTCKDVEVLTEDKPDATMENKPDATVQDKPDATVQDKPDATVQDNPDATVQDKPDATVQDKPDATVQDKPNISLGDKLDTSEKNKSDDDSSEDEFGFNALARQEREAISSVHSLTAIDPDSIAKDKCNDGSSEDEFGFNALAKLEKERRYPRRAVPTVNYKEAEVLQDDEYLFCDLCDREYEGDCPEHGPHNFFPDRNTPITGDGNRAVQTTPPMLKVGKSKIPGAGSGVWTVLGLPPHVRFGPYQGDESPEPDPLGYSWAIVKDKKVAHYIAAPSTATSNWMRFVNCARHESEQNLMAFQYKGNMYYRTVKMIPPKAELFVWYGKEYAELLGISVESFRSKGTSHLRDLVFSCDKCSVTYTSPLYLEIHEKKCRGEKTVRIVEPSRVPEDIQTLAVVVDGRKTYCCNLCSYKTKKLTYIKHHMLTHSGARPHVCDVCGKKFTQAGDLVRHKRIHSGEKLFKCSLCAYACNQSSDLKRHMTRHTGEKVYMCSQCGYRTSDSSNMKNHSRTHTGEKPYKCELCPYSASQSINLAKHKKTHTK